MNVCTDYDVIMMTHFYILFLDIYQFLNNFSFFHSIQSPEIVIGSPFFNFWRLRSRWSWMSGSVLTIWLIFDRIDWVYRLNIYSDVIVRVFMTVLSQDSVRSYRRKIFRIIGRSNRDVTVFDGQHKTGQNVEIVYLLYIFTCHKKYI